jgi:hypothetical protein
MGNIMSNKEESRIRGTRALLSSRCGTKFYLVGPYFIILSLSELEWDQLLSSGANVKMWSICYHVEADVVIWSILCFKVLQKI